MKQKRNTKMQSILAGWKLVSRFVLHPLQGLPVPDFNLNDDEIIL